MQKIAILLFCLLIYSCKSYHKQEPTKEEREKIEAGLIEDQLRDSKEKIVLLSVIKKIPYDTLFSILKDYNLELHQNNYTDYEKALFYTSQHHNFSLNQIALLIFNFNYEMMSRDDIIQDDINNAPEIPSTE